MTIQSERRVLGNDLRTSTDARLSPCQDKDTSRAVAARSGGIGRSLPQRKIIPAFGLPMDLRYSSKISAKARNYRHGIPAGPRLGKVDHRHPNGTIDRQFATYVIGPVESAQLTLAWPREGRDRNQRVGGSSPPRFTTVSF